MLRVLVGRDQQVHLYGPTGFVDRVHHKLQAYLWNLVDREPGDLTFLVTEIGPALATRKARFRLKTAFAAEAMGAGRADQGILVNEPAFRVSMAVLEHHAPCLGFVIEEFRSPQRMEDPAGKTGPSGRALATRPQACGDREQTG